jgi:rubredoxin
MAKWQCTICNYIYDPAKGDPENGVKRREPRGKSFPRTGYAPTAARRRASSRSSIER